MEQDLERVWYGDLQPSPHLPADSQCESCGGLIHRHMWADLDPNGYAEWCSVSEWLKIHTQ